MTGGAGSYSQKVRWLLTKCMDPLSEFRALLREYRALLNEYMALLSTDEYLDSHLKSL